MEFLPTIAALLIGSGLGYWWRNRSIVRELPSNSVWLFPTVKGSNIYKIQLSEIHNWWSGEPELWQLPVHEHPFSLKDKHSLRCSDFERLNIQCLIKVRPVRDVNTLEQLLGESDIEQINDAQWVFQKIQGALRTSTAVVTDRTREAWLSTPHELEQLWTSRLNDALHQWHCSIQIQSISATHDQFYDIHNPDEKLLLLNRSQTIETIQEVEERLATVQNLIEEENERIAHLHAKQTQAAELNIKWTALENHLASRRLEVTRKAQEHIEELRTEIRQQLRLTAADIQQEVGSQVDPQIIDDAELNTRNTLDTLLDSEQERTARMVHNTLSQDLNDSDSTDPS